MKAIDYELLLDYLVSEMERDGLVVTNYYFSLDNELVNKCNQFCNVQSTLNEYTEIVKLCITREYIKNATTAFMKTLAITHKGLGIVYSNRNARNQRNSRRLLKKLSDWVEEHKGLSILVGIAISLISMFFLKR